MRQTYHHGKEGIDESSFAALRDFHPILLRLVRLLAHGHRSEKRGRLSVVRVDSDSELRACVADFRDGYLGFNLAPSRSPLRNTCAHRLDLRLDGDRGTRGSGPPVWNTHDRSIC